MTDRKGRLFVVATPIGNLEDITHRALKILKEVDLIACEDTRHSKKLLSHYGITKKLVSYYKPKEHSKSIKIINELLDGKDVALISDAGTPAISDPGQLLIEEARINRIDIIGIPGPSSLITALSISGFKVVPFIFDGFFPKKRSEAIKRVERLREFSGSIVYFITARQITGFLEIVRDILGEKRVFIGRELTKVYEEIKIGTPTELINVGIIEKGEMVVIIENSDVKKNSDLTDDLEKLLLDAIKEKKTFKDIAKSDKFKNIKRNELYKLYEKLKKSL